MHGRRRDKLLASWEAEGAGVKAVVDALAMAIAAAGAKARVDALAMAMAAAAAGTVTTSTSPASVAFGDDRVVGEILDADNARRARDEGEALRIVDYVVDEERREEACTFRGRRRDEVLTSWEAEGAGAKAGVDALAMAMAAARAEAGVNALATLLREGGEGEGGDLLIALKARQ